MLLSASVHSELLVYDGFDVPAGSAFYTDEGNTGNSDFGWDGPWRGLASSDPTTQTITEGSLQPLGRKFATRGGALLSKPHANGEQVFFARDISPTLKLATPGKTVWFSFMAQASGGGAVNVFFVSADNQWNSENKVHIGSSDSMWALRYGGDGGQKKVSMQSITELTLIVGSITYNEGANDTVKVWLNPIKDPSFLTPTFEFTGVELGGLTRVTIQSTIDTGTTFDEFRIGDYESDVLPRI